MALFSSASLPMAVAAILVGASSALADITVRFDEGAPKDRFEIRNSASCALKDATITIDMSGSAGGLIFDVTNTGAGVEVFQPFEVVAGRKALAELPVVTDGDRLVTLRVATLPSGGTIAFTIDVDDTKHQREITVADSELKGATVTVQAKGQELRGTFGAAPQLSVKSPPCAA